MYKPTLFIALIVFVVSLSPAIAQEHTVEVIDRPPPADELSEEIAKLIADKGYSVKRGTSRTVCEVWFCKELKLEPGFKPTDDRLYPFRPGQLIGVLHFKRRGSEFRDQQISSGWYTLRFGLQPTDGNHEGTSPTRDFLLLVLAEQDEFADDWEVDALNEASSEAAGATHPAMLCLQRPTDGEKPAMRHDEQNDWWILHVLLRGVQPSVNVNIDLVVAGHAAE